MSRTQNSLRNIAFGLTGQILNIIMSFAMRTVFIHTLSDIYLGINGTFTDILMLFSLADLGVGTAIVYALYKPVAEQDKNKIKALMKLYGKAYRTIGVVIVIAGIIVSFFAESFIKLEPGQTMPDHVQIIFLLFVINTASTYFFAYKGTLITAHQKNYIVTNVVYATSILCYAVQIVVMLLTKQYMLTLSIQVATNVLQNIITMIIANRMYPYIAKPTKLEISPKERKKIFSDMGSIVFYRIGQLVINGTDTVIISSFVGAVQAGYNSNYVLLTTTVRNLLQQVFKAITASIGNLNVLGTKEQKIKMYKTVMFANFWMFGWASVCFYCLFTPFVTIWAGADRVLSEVIMTLIVANFYTQGMRNVNITFRDTMGIFREGRMVPIAAVIVNIVVSLALVFSLGMTGVYIGTLVSTASTLLWLEPKILFKYGFKTGMGDYFIRYAAYLLTTAVACVLTRLVCDFLFVQASILTIIGRLLICMIIPNLVFLIVFKGTDECDRLMDIAKGIFSKITRRIVHR